MADTRDGPEPHLTTREPTSGCDFATTPTLLAGGRTRTQHTRVGVVRDRLRVDTEDHRPTIADRPADRGHDPGTTPRGGSP
ncbi:hypothetical protein [Kineococcus arenarius]|uniref:hypothetical protein n=1 Tax=unclassified Kineococcus TaxID=2621656 RepID=UPI003D7C3DAC